MVALVRGTAHLGAARSLLERVKCAGSKQANLSPYLGWFGASVHNGNYLVTVDAAAKHLEVLTVAVVVGTYRTGDDGHIGLRRRRPCTVVHRA